MATKMRKQKLRIKEEQLKYENMTIELVNNKLHKEVLKLLKKNIKKCYNINIEKEN